MFRGVKFLIAPPPPPVSDWGWPDGRRFFMWNWDDSWYFLNGYEPWFIQVCRKLWKSSKKTVFPHRLNVVSARCILSSCRPIIERKPRLHTISRFSVIENSTDFSTLYFFLYLDRQIYSFSIFPVGYKPRPEGMQIFKSPA